MKIKEQYSVCEKEFKDLCVEIYYKSGIFNFVENKKSNVKIKEYQLKIDEKFEQLLSLSIERFPLVKKFHTNWLLDNEGYNNFVDYLVLQINKYIIVDNFQDKVNYVSTGVTGGSGLAMISLAVAKIMSENPHLTTPFLISAGVFGTSLATKLMLDFYSSKTDKNLQNLVYYYTEFIRINEKLEFVLKSNKEKKQNTKNENEINFSVENSKI